MTCPVIHIPLPGACAAAYGTCLPQSSIPSFPSYHTDTPPLGPKPSPSPPLDPQTLTTLRSAPIAGHALNASLLAVQTLGALLSGDSSPAGPSLRDHYPREALEDLPWPGAPPLSLPQRDEDLDWAHPTVWRAQRTARNGMPYYTAEDVDRLLYWCREGGGSGDSSSGAGTGDGEGGGGGAEGAEAGEGDGGDGGGLAGGLYGKLVKWIEDAGGDVAGVEPYVDERGMRGLRVRG